MKQQILKIANAKDWNELLDKLSDDNKDIYFTPEYYNLYEKNGDGEAYCFTLEIGSHIAIYPFLKKKINDLGYILDKDYYDISGSYGYNGVISNCNNDADFIESFNNKFNAYCKEQNIITEFTRFQPLLDNYKFSSSHLKVTLNRQTVFIDLKKSIEDIKSDFSKSNKRAIKKAIKSGLEVKTYQNKFPLKKEFISIYKETMSRVNSSEYLFFSDEYFEEIFKLSSAVQFACFLDNKLVASFLCFSSNDYFHYHFGASSFEYLNFRPNNLLFLEMIKFAKENNHKYIHFGGGKTQADDDSLLKFKSSFSSDRSEFYIGEKIHNKTVYDEIVSQWENKFPEKIEEFNSMMLKYRC
jgi:lipid II:glycine glycyltransferase (peptidoglycan interpeptide bridge formation enzyme)